MVFYFTATGNCLYVAKQLHDAPISIAQAIHDENPIYRDESIGIVAPVYSGELPGIVRRFLERSTFETDYLYLVPTYGKDDTVIGEWSYYYGKLHGVHIDYVHTVKMVDNFLPGFDMVEELAIDKEIPRQLHELKAALSKKRKGIPHPSEFGFKLYDMVSRRRASVGMGSPLVITDEKCIGCGICTKVCPVANIEIADGKARYLNKGCEMCLACIQLCPHKAINITFGEKNPEARFRNENIALSEIIESNNQMK